jgi:two-component system, NtrC family, response regulator HydG
MRTRVLVVDDEADSCEAYRVVLASDGCDVVSVTSASAALARLAESEFDVVVSDVVMKNMNGIELCRRVRETKPNLPVILLTGRGEMDMVIEALRAGAIDFLRKPIDAGALSTAVARALALQQTRTRSGNPTEIEAGQRRSCEHNLRTIFGTSASMQGVHARVTDLSSSLVSVLLQGESGTGKDVIAHAIHDSSLVSEGPFVALNCAAMPAGLLESSLFGHARGAFTDAKQSSKGLFLAANDGTLLLDEIGELPLELQPKLLRALQERTVRAVGGRDEVPFNCRLITATNRDLEREVARKAFREDLYYRLDVVRITLPPLRDRLDDILALAEHFRSRFATGLRENVASLSPALESALLAYSWPGNVRELENCIERAVTMAQGNVLEIDDLPHKVRYFEPAEAPLLRGSETIDVLKLDELERRHILRAMQLSNGNRTLAAKVLGVNRRTLQRRLEHFAVAGIEQDFKKARD